MQATFYYTNSHLLAPLLVPSVMIMIQQREHDKQILIYETSNIAPKLRGPKQKKSH